MRPLFTESSRGGLLGNRATGVEGSRNAGEHQRAGAARPRPQSLTVLVGAVGGVVGEVLRENGEEAEAADSRGKAMALWANEHGTVSLLAIERPSDDQEEAERLVDHAVRVHLASWRDD